MKRQNSSRNSYRNSHRGSYRKNSYKSRNVTNSTSDRIILNVGGIIHETTRSTLTSYPQTMLGRMFDPANTAMLKPTYPNGNEYFIDRNGHVFYYIMEFYRNGDVLLDERTFKITLPYHDETLISGQILRREFDYFQIPILENKIELAERRGAALVDEFADLLEEEIVQSISKIINRIAILFCENGSDSYQKGEFIRNFHKSGYAILKHFANRIKARIEIQFPSIGWQIVEYNNDPSMRLILTNFINIENVMDLIKSGQNTPENNEENE
ncbi:5572_t:CDS:2 [Funneliformis geosporum]|uniref:2599_t:CDS:1 n=1 Tax=Funneliformis geosporum TaxID=1117311 RepID=A0A9W4SLI2_9GLOM|nr:5572_t:CDS:2 [Funneliformis geosporum]CAI2173847.1 2599_t:CDS:2 [Funneliformis geosporum]